MNTIITSRLWRESNFGAESRGSTNCANGLLVSSKLVVIVLVYNNKNTLYIFYNLTLRSKLKFCVGNKKQS